MPFSNAEHSKGVTACVLLALSYSLFNIYVRELGRELAIFQQVYLRTLVGFIFGLVLFRGALSFQRLRGVPVRDWILLVSRATVLYLFGVVFFTKAVLVTSLANVGFIVAIPYYVIWGMLLFGERLTLAKGLGILLGVCGVALLSLKSKGVAIQCGQGELYALLCGLSFSLGVVTRKFHTEYLRDGEMVQLFLLFGFAVVFLASLYSGEPLQFNPSNRLLFVLMLSGIFLSLNTFLANYVFARLSAVLAGNILTLEMLFVMLLGFLLYGEIPTPRSIFGGVLVLSSVLLVNWFEGKERMRDSGLLVSAMEKI